MGQGFPKCGFPPNTFKSTDTKFSSFVYLRNYHLWDKEKGLKVSFTPSADAMFIIVCLFTVVILHFWKILSTTIIVEGRAKWATGTQWFEGQNYLLGKNGLPPY